MPDEHHTRTEGAGQPDDSRPASFGGLTEAAGLGPATPDTDFLIGRVVAGVTIVRLIAEGGMGRVYEGLQDKPRRPVAVKVMRPGFVSREACRRFDHEAEVLGKLRHPSIAQIHSAGIYDMMGTPVPYFVMEYIPNALPITKFAAAHGLTTDQRLQLFREVCEAVAEGHKQGIVHRDLKPSNILVEPPQVAGRIGTPKIIDFGVARSIDAAPEAMTGMTDMGRLIGTLQYMSPEQFLGDPAGIDVRADVYALGVILYELLAGQPPYEIRQQQIFEAARIVREQAPKPVTSANRSVRPEVARITDTCLRKDPRQRYANASELAGAVQACLDGGPAPARLASDPHPPALTGRLWHAWPLVFAAVAVALVSGVVLVRRLPQLFEAVVALLPTPPVPVWRQPDPPQPGPPQPTPPPDAPTTDVVIASDYEDRVARIKRRDEEVPRLLAGYPQDYLTVSTENEPHRDVKTGELVVPLQISFDRDQYLKMAKQVAALMKIDEDRHGEVTCDGTVWETARNAGLTPSADDARKNMGRGPFKTKSPVRGANPHPLHRGWHELHKHVTAHIEQYPTRSDLPDDNPARDVIVVLLVDITPDFSLTKWEWFHLSRAEYKDLLSCVDLLGIPFWGRNGDERGVNFNPLDCITSVTGPDNAQLQTDRLPVEGLGLKLTRIPGGLHLAVVAPFFVSPSQWQPNGSFVDWYIPHWFVERRLELPSPPPNPLTVKTFMQAVNAVPNAKDLKIVENAIGMKLVQIPPGTFRKEVRYEHDDAGWGGRKPGPMIDVRIEKPFWIGQEDVTNSQWLTVMNEPFSEIPPKFLSPSQRERMKSQPKPPGALPVWVRGDRPEIRDFCHRLTELDRQKGLISDRERYMLPTECQWEYACGSPPSKSDQLDDPLWQSRPNAHGLLKIFTNYGNLCANSDAARKDAGETSDGAEFADILRQPLVLRGGVAGDLRPQMSRVGLRLVRVTIDPE